MATARWRLLAARRSGRGSAASVDGPRLFCDDEGRRGAEASIGRASTIPVPAPESDGDEAAPANVAAASRSAVGSDQPNRQQEDSRWPVIDGYTLRAVLGADGMGTVYRAFDLQLQREVALKVPRAVHADAQAQFLTEARVLARLKHPHVVGVHAAGCAGEQVFLTMDLIDGQDAARLLELLGARQAARLRGPTLLHAAGVDLAAADRTTWRAACRPQAYYRLAVLWIAQAAEGLQAAHRQGILHRDVKPSNLLLASDGRMLVGDFGLARDLRMPAEEYPGVTGTYPYLAPERVTGDWANVDHRADIWALGATLYEFLTFQRAYPRHGKEVLQDIATAEPAPPRAIDDHVPAELQRICLKAMSRRPDDRYQTAQEMAGELRAWAESPLLRWHPRVALGAVALLALITFVLAYAQWPAQLQRVPASDPAPDAPPAAARPTARPGDEQRVATSPTPTYGEPARPPTSQAVLPTLPVALLAFNEDLNAEDDQPPHAGGTADSHFRRAFEQGDPRVALKAPLEAPPRWSPTLAVETARHLGASVAIVGELKARPIGRITNLGPAGDTVYRWELRLSLELIRVADEYVEHLPDVCATATRLEAEQYGGDGIPGLVAEALPDVHTKLVVLFGQYVSPEHVKLRR